LAVALLLAGPAGAVITVEPGVFLLASSVTDADGEDVGVGELPLVVPPFDESFVATSPGGGVATTGARIEVESVAGDVGTATVTASGDASVTHPLLGDEDHFISSSADSKFGVRICVDRPASYTGQVQATIEAGNPQSSEAEIGFCCDENGEDVVRSSEDGDPVPLSLPLVGSLAAGNCLEVGAGVDPRLDYDLGLPTARGSWRVSLSVSEDTPSDVFVWKGGAQGSFGDPTNWDPEGPATEGVPTKVVGVRADTALFQGSGAVVDLGGGVALAAAAPLAADDVPSCSGVVTRITERKVIDQTGETPPVEVTNGTLQLDALSASEPSLIVRNGGHLLLDEGAVCARHADIGTSGSRSVATVLGPGGNLQTLARLSIGLLGEGILNVLHGGIARSELVQIGDGEKLGGAWVSDATWQTGNIAIGFVSPGQLLIDEAGLVISEVAAVDVFLSGGELGVATVKGEGSTWRVGDLRIGGRGTVEVREDGRIEVTAPTGIPEGLVLVGREGSELEARLLVNSGGELETEGALHVGVPGRGLLVVVEDVDERVADVGGTLLIGHPGPDAEVRGTGRVVIQGSPFTDEFSLVSNEVDIKDGRLEINGLGKLLTGEDAFVGSDGNATVKLFGTIVGDPVPGVERTRWQIGHALEVGGATLEEGFGFLEIGDGVVSVGTPSTAGSAWIRPGGAVLGSGPKRNVLRVVGGPIRNDGLIEGPLVLDGSYDPASTGQILASFAQPPAPALAPLAAQAAADAAPAVGPVVITGDAALGGTVLVLRFRNGFAPVQGQAFDVIQVGGTLLSGFADVEVQGLAPGSAFQESLAGGVLTLTSLTDAVPLPTVGLEAESELLGENQQGVAVRFSRAGDSSDDLTVRYAIRGTARNGIDYQPLPGEIEIEAAEESATLDIVPFADGLDEDPETIELEVLDDDDYTASLTSRVTIELLSPVPEPGGAAAGLAAVASLAALAARRRRRRRGALSPASPAATRSRTPS
jgi:hypothetical protein